MTPQAPGRSVLRACVSLLTAVASLLVGSMARAQPSLDLTWTAPEGCPERAWVLAAVERLVKSPSARAPLQVSAAVREQEGGWIVDLEMDGAASGTRTLRAKSCASVARATALIVAIALDPQAAAHATDELAHPEEPAAPSPDESAPRRADVESAAVPEATPPPVAVRALDRPNDLRPVVTAAAAAERALLPGLAMGVAIGGGVVWRRLRADLTAHVSPHASVSLNRVPGVGADFALAALSLRACAGHTMRALAVHGCAAVRGARISGEGTGIAEAYRQTAHLLALEPAILVRAPGRTGPAVELDTAVVLPLARPDFVMLSSGPSEPLFRVSAVGLRVALGASYRF